MIGQPHPGCILYYVWECARARTCVCVCVLHTNTMYYIYIPLTLKPGKHPYVEGPMYVNVLSGIDLGDILRPTLLLEDMNIMFKI